MAKKAEQVKELYPLDVLRANCKELFNIEKEVFDGAFYELEDNGEISKEEAEVKIKEWLEKEVK